MKIICYELNEVPWQIVDYYLHERPRSALGSILQNALQYTTHTHDVGELHPWSTWPTLHRGVYNTAHNIRFLNQEILCPYPPLWQLLCQAGVSCGIFGSLHTWPVPEGDPYAFYIPDTFARSPETLPSHYTSFQKLNLRYTEQEGGKVHKPLKPSRKDLQEAWQLFRSGLSLGSLGNTAFHLFKEYLNPVFKSLRPTLQAPIAFDFYKTALEKFQPHFSTFFTNHVASMMHRYWKHAFPHEAPAFHWNSEDSFKQKNILRAMDIADRQLSYLKEFCDRHGYVLMILSSMGQEFIHRGDYAGELHLSCPKLFLKMLGYEGPTSQNLAMHPDFSFAFPKKSHLNRFKSLLGHLTSDGERPLFTLKEAGLTLNCNLASTPSLVTRGHVFRDGAPVTFSECGFSIENRDQGTGYHQPKGLWIVYKEKLKCDPYRREVESIKVAPTLLALYGITRPDYMTTPEIDVVESLSLRNAHPLG